MKRRVYYHCATPAGFKNIEKLEWLWNGYKFAAETVRFADNCVEFFVTKNGKFLSKPTNPLKQHFRLLGAFKAKI